MTVERFCDYILNKNGRNQMLKAAEEHEEVAHALIRWYLAQDDQSEAVENIAEEVADACLMIRQIRQYFDIGDLEIEQRMQKKIDRYFELNGEADEVSV